MKSKILSVSIVIMMVCVSFSMLSGNAPAEDVTSAFMEKNTGYPSTSFMMDVEYDDPQDTESISTGPYAQTFKPTMNGELVSIDLYLTSPGGIGNLMISINETVGGEPAALLSFDSFPEGYFGGDGWYNFVFSSPATLTSGVQYAIVLDVTGTYDAIWWFGGIEYTNGDGYWNSAGTWSSYGADFCFRTYMQATSDGIKHIAWYPSGDFALGVTGVDETVYQYTRSTGAWSTHMMLGAGEIMNDIVYDQGPGWDLFYIAGKDASNQPLVYEYNYNPMGGSTQPRTMGGTNGEFFGIERSNDGASNYKFLAVGKNYGTGDPLMLWYDYSSGWVPVTSGLINGDTLYDACWNNDDAYIIVGEDSGANGVVYGVYTGSPATNRVSTGWDPMGSLKAIDWNDDYPTYDFAIMAGDNIGNGNIWQYTTGAPTALYNTTEQFYDLDFFPSGPHIGTCQVVGMDGSSQGIMCTINPAATKITVNTISSSPCKGIALKGPSSPSSGIITSSSGGIAYYPDAQSQDTTITANAVFPKLYWIGFNETSGINRLDQQVSIDNWYDFTLEGNYSQGWANCEVVVQAWFDNGAVGAGSIYPAENEANRNLAFQLTYTVGGACVIDYPLAGTEINTAAVTDMVSWAHPTDAAQDYHYVEIPIYLGAQIRNASGDGFDSGDADYDPLANNALLDAWSWDFNVTIRDAGNPTAKNVSYGEFGIDRSISISVAGNPAGNAPPGSSDMALSNPSQITYSSNANYWVNVSVPNLEKDGIGPLNIAATNVAVANANVFADLLYTEMNGADYPVGVQFPGAGADLCVWGNRSQVQTHIDPPGNGTVAFGPFGSDYNAGWTNVGVATTQLNWWVTVPGSTQEGVYWAYITITIESEG